MAAVDFEQVSKIYPDGTTAVSHFDLDVPDGEFMVLVGPSGCGKTTALRMLAGLEDITRGVIKIGERVVNYVPSRDRDIAMVFQSYALYPHLSVYENIAFGLRVKKVPKAEIDRRVKDAARILDLEPFLKRKPRALSGGQRQRVAMGRAIVRQPQAFLMDEPLSNLDAKLRVQMRAEISGLQKDLGVTTIYVTHDQVEAMTMGDRVAVMRKGELQQVAHPQELYDRPVNLFVGGFIGSPAMNMLEATLGAERDARRAARTQTVGLGEETLAAHPALRRYAGKTVVLGIRPEDLEDAALASEATPHSRLRGKVKLREALGSEIMVHFTVDAKQAVTEHVIELAEDVDEAAVQSLQERPSETTMIGRFGARSTRRRGGHRRRRGRHPQPPFLRPGDRLRDLRRHQRERSVMSRKRIALTVVAGVAVAAALVVAGLAGASTKARSHVSAVSGSVSFDGIWTSSTGQKQFADVIKAFNKVFPKVKINYKPVGNNIPTVLTTAVAGGHPPDMADIAQPGLVDQFAKQGQAQADQYAKPALARNFAPAWHPARDVQGQALRDRLQGGQQVDRLVQRARFQDGRRQQAEDMGSAPRDREDAAGLGNARLLDRRRGGLDAHRPVREHLSAHVRAGEVHPPERAQDQVDGQVRDHGADDDGQDPGRHVERRRRNVGGDPDQLQRLGHEAFSTPPKAAMVFEGDFVGSVITTTTKAKALSGFNVFASRRSATARRLGRRDRR